MAVMLSKDRYGASAPLPAYSWLLMGGPVWMLMNALPEEPPALDLGSVSTLLGATSASVIKASTSCTLEANTNVTI